jgi:hypothetical protein
MDHKEICHRLEIAIDVLADIEHERWAHWQSYLHSKGVRQSDGSLVIPADLIAKWEYQVVTSFANLSDSEKDSDREQVRKYIPAVAKILCE